MTVVELKTRPVEVVESVVERLESTLAMAREGKITSLAIAMVESGGETSCCWSETDDFGRLLGSIARLQHRMNIRQDQAL